MIASLAMYDFGPVMAAANDRLWALIRDGLRARGIAGARCADRGEAAYWQAWEAADLVLSQTCGYPYRARLHSRVTYVGTPDYAVDGCPPGHYRSVFVARADDPADLTPSFDGAAFAYNEGLSNPAGPRRRPMPPGWDVLPPALQTGGHRLSALAVAEGRADIAAWMP
jgi:hypothetical protein